MAVRNVVFDFGGVLVRWRPLELIERFYPEGPLRRRVKEMVFEHADWVEMDRGSLSDAVAAERFADRLGRPQDEMHSLLQHVKDSLTPLPDTVAILRGLKSRGVPLYGLSNMSAATFAYLKARHTFWADFLGIVISAHVGLVKPDPRIFDHLSERYALDPAETLFIDDHLPNIESAGRRGFHTIHFSDAKECLERIETHLDGGGASGGAAAGAS